MSASFPSTAAAATPTAVPGELPPYTARQLGPDRAALARALRHRMMAAGITWPLWIDARPGRLQVILGDCSDPPLGETAAALVQQYGALILDGIAGLGLITAVSRLVLCASAPKTLAALRALCVGSSVTVVATPAVYPACPEADVPEAGGKAHTVSAAQLVQIGALVRGQAPPHLCTVAGAVVQPQVIEHHSADAGRADGNPASPRDPETPTTLVRRCGGAKVTAWVAVIGGALGGVLWPADAPLPADTSLCLILPVTHELVARLRRGDPWRVRARNTCLSCRVCTDFCPVAQAGIPLAPHRLMRELAGQGPVDTTDPAVSDAAHAATACTGCGACSVMCPAALLPGAAIRSLGVVMASRETPSPSAPVVTPSFAPALTDRRVPLPLLLTRLGLTDYVPPT